MAAARPDCRRRRAGFSLIELLIAMVMLLAITAAAWSLFQSQSQAFRANIDRWEMVQNARAALEGAQRVIRTMGAGTTGDQPVLVYGAGTVLAFNTDYIEADTGATRWATYFNPDTPLTDATSWDPADATAIPNSSYTYPTAQYLLGSGVPSPAETYIFYFVPDDATARPDDYVMYQRVNNGTPEIVARNILPHPNGRPFFSYLMTRQSPGGDTLMLVPDANLPLIRRQLVAGLSSSDSADYVRPDSVRAVRMDFRLTNGQTGADERFRDITTTIEVHNNGLALPTVCGRAPLAPGSLAVADSGSGRLWLTWTSSPDQDGGEHDVLQYMLFRKLASGTTWGGPLLVVRTQPGTASYSTAIAGNTPNTDYLFGIAAEDCTPAQSAITSVAWHTLP